MKILHQKQAAILEFIKKNGDKKLVMKEASQAAHITSPGVLYFHLTQLEKKGYIKKEHGSKQQYITFDTPENNITYINNYGPLSEIKNFNTPANRIPFASRLLKFPVIDAIIIEADDSQMEPSIISGDLVIIQRTENIKSNNFIICIHNDVVKLKQYFEVGNRKILATLNKENPFFEVKDSDHFNVIGVVKNIFRTL